MGGLKPQKIYVSEEQRRKDQRGGQDPEPRQGFLSLFNAWASDQSERYRRDVFNRAAELERRIEDGLKNTGCLKLQEEWQQCLEDIKAKRTGLKVGYSKQAVKDCYQAIILDDMVEKTIKNCPF